MGSILPYLSIRSNNNDFPGNHFPAGHQRTLHRGGDAAAARHIHAQHGETLDFVVLQDGCEFIGIIPLVELRAANQGDSVAHEVLMYVRVGKGSTVRRHQYIGIVQIRCLDWNELDLYGPLTKRGFLSERRRRFGLPI